MKALSIRSPWAYLIVFGFPLSETYDNENGSQSVRFSGKVVLKDIENRTWPTKFRGRVYVHVGQKADYDAWEWLVSQGFAMFTSLSLCGSKSLPRGVIIGEVDIVDCVTESKSMWFEGPYGLVLRHPKPYREPIPWKGRLGFFEGPEVRGER